MPASRCAIASRTRRLAAADHRRGARRLRHAGRAGLFRFCRSRAFPARDGRRGRDPHHPALLLQISRRREDRRGPGAAIASCCWPSGFPARRPSPTAWPSARRVETICGARGAAARAGAAHDAWPSSSGCAITSAAIAGICASTALAVATSQAAHHRGGPAAPELRASAGHRYLFGLAAAGRACAATSRTTPAGALADDAPAICRAAARARADAPLLQQLPRPARGGRHGRARAGARLRPGRARSRAPRASRATCASCFPMPPTAGSSSRCRSRPRATATRACACCSARRSSRSLIIRELAGRAAEGPVARADRASAGAALGAVEAPLGAAFHWLRLGEDGTRRRVGGSRRRPSPTGTASTSRPRTSRSRTFPIIMASFGLSNAECDR